MPRVMQGTERQSQRANAKREKKSTAGTKRRGERQKQPKRNAIQGRGMAKRNNTRTGPRRRVKG